MMRVTAAPAITAREWATLRRGRERPDWLGPRALEELRRLEDEAATLPERQAEWRRERAIYDALPLIVLAGLR